jgi:type I site-specific restriction-modification system R (restriction) subunit
MPKYAAQETALHFIVTYNNQPLLKENINDLLYYYAAGSGQLDKRHNLKHLIKKTFKKKNLSIQKNSEDYSKIIISELEKSLN